MGLDMILFGVNDYFEPEKPIKMNLEEVAYWRKANAIHNWIVANVQDNVDNCAYYYMEKRQLKQLLTICEKILANPTVENAMELLPTKSGFFFGGVDLNKESEMKWYLDGLEYTVEIFKQILKEDKYEYFFYHSSW